MVSYAQQCAQYWAYAKANPDMGVTKIHNHFAGGTYGMRKTDSIDLIHKMKDADKYRKAMGDSQAPDDVKERTIKYIYQRAKMTSKKYLKNNPLKKGKIRLTPEQMYDDTFGYGEKPRDFDELY